MNAFYREMNIYTDEQEDRMIFFLQASLLIDTISIDNSYSSALSGMLEKLKVKTGEIEMTPITVTDDEIALSFNFVRHSKRLHGYGYMYKKEEYLESIWLLPIERGFSLEFIDVFDSGIFAIE